MKRMASIAGADLQVHIEGSGPPMLLVHGFPLDHSMWRHQWAGLEGFQVAAVDLRGFGESTGELPDVLTMSQLADDLAALIDALEWTQPIVLCSLSMGGYVSLEFVHRHRSRLSSLILCDTRAAADSNVTAKARQIASHKVLAEGTQGLANDMFPKLLADESIQKQPELDAELRAMMQRADPKAVAGALRGMAQRSDHRPLLPTIDVPTLLICGSEDVITPAREMRQMAESIPDATYVQIEGAGHMAPMEDPKATNRAICQFLQGL